MQPIRPQKGTTSTIRIVLIAFPFLPVRVHVELGLSWPSQTAHTRALSNLFRCTPTPQENNPTTSPAIPRPHRRPLRMPAAPAPHADETTRVTRPVRIPLGQHAVITYSTSRKSALARPDRVHGKPPHARVGLLSREERPQISRHTRHSDVPGRNERMASHRVPCPYHHHVTLARRRRHRHPNQAWISHICT